MERDLRYFRRRASQERMAALNAGLPVARQAHLDLAYRYEELVRATASQGESNLHLIERSESPS